jgi:hypothetical protein
MIRNSCRQERERREQNSQSSAMPATFDFQTSRSTLNQMYVYQSCAYPFSRLAQTDFAQRSTYSTENNSKVTKENMAVHHVCVCVCPPLVPEHDRRILYYMHSIGVLICGIRFHRSPSFNTNAAELLAKRKRVFQGAANDEIELVL